MTRYFTFIRPSRGITPAFALRRRELEKQGLKALAIGTHHPQLSGRRVVVHLHDPLYDDLLDQVRPALSRVGAHIERIAVEPAPEPVVETEPELVVETEPELVVETEPELVTEPVTESEPADGTPAESEPPEPAAETIEESDAPELEPLVAIARPRKSRSAVVLLSGDSITDEIVEQAVEATAATENPIFVEDSALREAASERVHFEVSETLTWDETRAVITDNWRLIHECIANAVPVFVLGHEGAEELTPFRADSIETLVNAIVASAATRQAYLEQVKF